MSFLWKSKAAAFSPGGQPPGPPQRDGQAPTVKPTLGFAEKDARRIETDALRSQAAAPREPSACGHEPSERAQEPSEGAKRTGAPHKTRERPSRGAQER